MKNGSIGWQPKPMAPNPNAPPVRELMVNGRWKVPADQRPKLAQPPREESRQAYQQSRSGHTIGEYSR